MKWAFAAILFTVSAASFAAPEFLSIQEKAQGQSLTGAKLLNDSLNSNPAGSGFTSVYALDGTFLSAKTFGVSVLDTKTSNIGGALGFFRTRVDHSETPMQGVKLGLMGKASQNIALGLTGKAVWGPTLQNDSGRMHDVDIGALFNLDPVMIGFSIRNLIGGSEALGYEREWSLGARANYKEILFFSASLTSRWAYLRPNQYGIGAEYVSPYFFSLKGGFRVVPDQNQSFWTAGASILTPKIAFHYAVEFPNQGSASIEHLLGVTMLF